MQFLVVSWIIIKIHEFSVAEVPKLVIWHTKVLRELKGLTPKE